MLGPGWVPGSHIQGSLCSGSGRPVVVRTSSRVAIKCPLRRWTYRGGAIYIVPLAYSAAPFLSPIICGPNSFTYCKFGRISQFCAHKILRFPKAEGARLLACMRIWKPSLARCTLDSLPDWALIPGSWVVMAEIYLRRDSRAREEAGA